MRGCKDQITKQRYSTLEQSDSKEAGASEKRAKKVEFLFLFFLEHKRKACQIHLVLIKTSFALTINISEPVNVSCAQNCILG